MPTNFNNSRCCPSPKLEECFYSSFLFCFLCFSLSVISSFFHKQISKKKKKIKSFPPSPNFIWPRGYKCPRTSRLLLLHNPWAADSCACISAYILIKSLPGKHFHNVYLCKYPEANMGRKTFFWDSLPLFVEWINKNSSK